MAVIKSKLFTFKLRIHNIIFLFKLTILSSISTKLSVTDLVFLQVDLSFRLPISGPYQCLAKLIYLVVT